MTKARPPGRAGAALLIAGLALAACQQPPKKESFACPRIGLLDGASQRALPTGADRPTAQAQLRSYTGSCRYDGEGLVLDLTVDIVVQALPKTAAPAIDVPYFAAVQNLDGDVIAKRRYTVANAPLAAGEQRRLSHTLEAAFDLPDSAQPGGYTVLVGFPSPATTAPVPPAPDQ